MTGITPVETWMALLHLRPLPNIPNTLDGAAGAYAWVLALAPNADVYKKMASATMRDLGFFIADIEDLSLYHESHDRDDGILECAERLSKDCPVQYHTFYSYHHDEA